MNLTLTIIKTQFTKRLDLIPRHQRTSLGISAVSSRRWPRPLALMVASKIISWKKPTKKAKKIKFRIALSSTTEITETNQDIQWGQCHSSNLPTWWGNNTLSEKPIEKTLKTSVKNTGPKVLSHNSYRKKGELLVKSGSGKIRGSFYLGMGNKKVKTFEGVKKRRHLRKKGEKEVQEKQKE